jgi:hypothetical protein
MAIWLVLVQGKPDRVAAFPLAALLDYGARGAGQALREEELLEACSQLGPRLEALDISGAFQLTSAGLQGALGCCPVLRRLAADCSMLQDDALNAVLLGSCTCGSGAAGDCALADSQATGSLASMQQGRVGKGPWVAPPPLARLESLSLRGCLFLRGSLLAGLAACPALTHLDLAHCALALR